MGRQERRAGRQAAGRWAGRIGRQAAGRWAGRQVGGQAGSSDRQAGGRRAGRQAGGRRAGRQDRQAGQRRAHRGSAITRAFRVLTPASCHAAGRRRAAAGVSRDASIEGSPWHAWEYGAWLVGRGKQQEPSSSGRRHPGAATLFAAAAAAAAAAHLLHRHPAQGAVHRRIGEENQHAARLLFVRAAACPAQGRQHPLNLCLRHGGQAERPGERVGRRLTKSDTCSD